MIWKVFTNKFSRALNIAILDLEHAILSFFMIQTLERGSEGGGGGGGEQGRGDMCLCKSRLAAIEDIDSISLALDRVNKLVSQFLSFCKSSLNVLLPDRCHGITRHLFILFNTDVLEKPTR